MEKQAIDGQGYLVNLFFRDGKIYTITLIQEKHSSSLEGSKTIAQMRAQAAAENQVQNSNVHDWGRVVSFYDAARDITETIIYYSVTRERQKFKGNSDKHHI